MTYDEAMDDETIVTRQEAYKEVVLKHLDRYAPAAERIAQWDAFLTDCGHHETYKARAVLEWLGY